MSWMNAPKLGLTAQILIGLIAGVITGLTFGEMCSALEPLGTAFIKLMQITVLPSVTISIISGIGGLNESEARLIARKGCLVMLMMWSIGVIAFFLMQLSFPTLLNASFFSIKSLPDSDEVNLIDVFIPSNLFHSLSEGALPAIVLFSILLGFTLIGDDRKNLLLDPLKVLSSALSRMTRIVTRIIPIGVFVISANTAGTLTFERFLELQVFFLSLVVLASLMVILVLPLLTSCFTPFTYREILSVSSRAIILGFSTGNDFITLPLIADGIKNLFKSAGEKEKVQYYSEVLVPLSYSFPTIGAFVPFLFVLFTAWFYQDTLDLNDQILLVLAGLPTFFGSTRASIQFLLDLLSLPADALNLYVSSNSVHIYFVTALTSMSLFTSATICTAILSKSSGFRPKKVLLSTTVIAVAFVLAIGGLNMGFSHLLANTYHQDKVVESMGLPGQEGMDVKVYLSPEEIPEGDDITTVMRIRERGALRVGYNANCIPFVFFNKSGALVGYDVEMAYDLAKFLGVSRLEFIPITGDNMVERINSYQCDIIMSSVLVTPERLEEMKFTTPYMTLHLAMVVKDGMKDDFMNMEEIQMMKGLKIAVPFGSELSNTSTHLFPYATLVKLNDSKEFFTGDKADALLTTAEEGSVLTLLYPFYDVAMLQPSDVYKVMCGYPVAKDSDELFIRILNYWLKMDEDYGVSDKRYNHWILGKDVEKDVPRWCIVKDVLHWRTPC